MPPCFAPDSPRLAAKQGFLGSKMNELALFAGAGGGILGGHLLGWRTVCAVEYEPYAASVLVTRQNDGILPPFPVWDDVRTFDGKPWRGIVDVVSGGFPCQDISVAGKGAGIAGERSGLWSEMARIVGEVRPRYVFIENSPMLRTRGLSTVLKDLAEMGYNAEWGVLGAHHAGAPHKRDRMWILATNANMQSRITEQKSKYQRPEKFSGGSNRKVGSFLAYSDQAQQSIMREEVFREKQSIQKRSCCNGNEVSDSNKIRLQGLRAIYDAQRWEDERRQAGLCDREDSGREINWWEAEPDVGRVVDELANRLDFIG
jgi:DNA (cytosine-5)-methyltransferase 1